MQSKQVTVLLVAALLFACSSKGAPSDAGTRPDDAGLKDAGEQDAGTMDAGPMDAGEQDAGPMDAGPVDAGPADAGITCLDNKTPCEGVCVNTLTDTANCGTCGTSCGPAGTCVNGGCQCPTDTMCGTPAECVDETSDPLNCAGCGNSCAEVASGEDACAGSQCLPDYDWAQWQVPSDAPTNAAYMVSGDGATATDLVTQLVWQVTVSGTTYDWSDAQTACENLSLESLSGWRLPSYVELLSLVDFSASGPVINSTVFPGTPQASFWTSSAYSSNDGNAWAVNFTAGHSGGFDDSTASMMGMTYNIRCVWSSEGGASATVPDGAAPPGRYVISNGGTSSSVAYDTVTGLAWQQAAPTQMSTWTDAGTYCAGLSAGGLVGNWRLPTVKELATIVDVGAGIPAVDPTTFPGTPSGYFWTSTPEDMANGSYWVIYFYDGTTTVWGDDAYVRCVH